MEMWRSFFMLFTELSISFVCFYGSNRLRAFVALRELSECLSVVSLGNMSQVVILLLMYYMVSSSKTGESGVQSVYSPKFGMEEMEKILRGKLKPFVIKSSPSKYKFD